jgi:acetyltransferase-like isoleucine patch superfamily enzyme
MTSGSDAAGGGGGFTTKLRRRAGAYLRKRTGRLSEAEANERLKAQGKLTVGRRSYGDPHIAGFSNSANVHIGAFCSLGHGVHLIPGGNHRTDWVTTFPMRRKYGIEGAGRDGHPWSKGDIVIGNDVWMGVHAVVLSGVTIGNGAVVAAYAVVTHDVEPYEIVAGNPARSIGTRFGDEQIAALEEIRWWEWPDDKIVDAIPRLSSDDIDGFIAWARR